VGALSVMACHLLFYFRFKNARGHNSASIFAPYIFILLPSVVNKIVKVDITYEIQLGSCASNFKRIGLCLAD